MDPTKLSWAELADEAKYEVGQRAWVYPKRVLAGKMKQADADKHAARMIEIERRLRQAAKREAPDLFDV